ncbi:hypothetical protein AUJ14_01790 [Candidatus Micrarchaeota archaeon CG1_02_55_22]|nr:MAG: hypothetical protein AUJ14_01790 [Candidatus Micrarchaeota archaeon CG1_02_55_22]
MLFDEALNGLAEQVRSFSERRLAAVAALKSATLPESTAFDFLEPGLKLEVQRAPFNGSVAAVDGGIVSQEFQSVDLFAYRSCGVVFDYVGGNRTGHAYYPSSLPQTELHWDSSLNSQDFNWVKNLKRLSSELSCALELEKKHAPNLLLLDGSIVPQISDKPSAGSSVSKLYDEAVATLLALYEACTERGTLLAGVVKDSRGRHFTDLCRAIPAMREYGDVLERTNDATLLYDFLSVGERSPAFKYASEASESSVLTELGAWSKKISSLYLKPVAFDRPLRVDFLAHKPEDIARVATAVDSLSRLNKNYAYPAVLIEADLRAAMDGAEIDYASAALTSKLGFYPELFRLRRDSRPFR